MPGFVGSTYDVNITLKDRTGNLNLTGWIFEGEWYDKGTDTVKVAIPANQITTPYPLNGQVAVHVTSQQTTTLGDGFKTFALWRRIDADNRQLIGIGTEQFGKVSG